MTGIAGLHVIVTDYGTVRVSDSTLKVMDATFPGWRDVPIKGRTKAVRRYNTRAENGADALDRAASAIAYLAWCADQDLTLI